MLFRLLVLEGWLWYWEIGSWLGRLEDWLLVYGRCMEGLLVVLEGWLLVRFGFCWLSYKAGCWLLEGWFGRLEDRFWLLVLEDRKVGCCF